MHRTALDSSGARHGNDHPNVAVHYSNIDNVYGVRGEYDEALVQ